MSKSGFDRTITITRNLKAWLEAYEGEPIFSKNFDRLNKEFRKKHGFTHDETRHSFISYHVALHPAVDDAALQAGNSEAVIKKHYLKLPPESNGRDYFSIVPDMTKGEAVTDESFQNDTEKPFLKAI